MNSIWAIEKVSLGLCNVVLVFYFLKLGPESFPSLFNLILSHIDCPSLKDPNIVDSIQRQIYNNDTSWLFFHFYYHVHILMPLFHKSQNAQNTLLHLTNSCSPQRPRHPWESCQHQPHWSETPSPSFHKRASFCHWIFPHKPEWGQWTPQSPLSSSASQSPSPGWGPLTHCQWTPRSGTWERHSAEQQGDPRNING